MSDKGIGGDELGNKQEPWRLGILDGMTRKPLEGMRLGSDIISNASQASLKIFSASPVHWALGLFVRPDYSGDQLCISSVINVTQTRSNIASPHASSMCLSPPLGILPSSTRRHEHSLYVCDPQVQGADIVWGVDVFRPTEARSW